jgi:hypothetical protein
MLISIEVELCLDFEENQWRKAEIKNVPCEMQSNGNTVEFEYADDGWGNSGIGQIRYVQEEDWYYLELTFIDVTKNGVFGLHKADGWSFFP